MQRISRFHPAALATIVLTTAGSLWAATPRDNSSWVNPIIGTNGMGHTFPGACAPFGIVQLSPDTENVPHNIDGKYQPGTYEYCAGYQHRDSTIVGFSHTHLSGTGHSDLGDVMLMPATGVHLLVPGDASDTSKGYRSRFEHSTEVTRPGYYAVTLDDYGIRAELTATQRVGAHRYTYPDTAATGHVVLDMDHGIYNYDGKTLWTYMRVENDSLITGYRITNGWARTNYTYFAIQFSEPMASYGFTDLQKPLYNGGWGKFDQHHNFPEMAGRKVVAYFDFNLPESRQVEVKVGLSGVSTEGALMNLRAETAGKDFDAILASTTADWNRSLDIIEAEGTPDQLAMLYTSLYHTMINPSVYMDVDGSYRGLDHNIHHADGFTNYTVFSIWDTFRAEHPLMNVFFPERGADMAKSMMAHYSQSVHKALPVWSHMGNENWCMAGYHAVSVLADAYAKGGDLDSSLALEAMNSSATIPYYTNLDDYMAMGYVPFEKNGSAVSITLEYAYDDWCIYNTALRAGDTALAETYRKRAMNYRNVFDPELQFSRPRHADGTWKTPFSLLNTSNEGFLEGNSWNYSFFVPHDVKGLIEAMGGENKFVQNLDSLFIMEFPAECYQDTEDVTEEGLIGCYVHGNEPSHHIPYLYAWTSQPWKTQYWVREIMNRMYRNNIDGLCGNDDCGQMSAWYVFTALGFYPVCPGTDQYVLGAPYLPYARLTLGNGKTLEVKAPKVSDRNRYVKSVALNGKTIEKTYLTHDELMGGGVLEFEMASTPQRKRGIAAETKPYSLSDEKK